MLSESTARLVEHTVMLAEPEWVHIKGADKPVRARRLVAISPRDGLVGRAEASLVGRRWEMTALDAMTDQALGGRGGVGMWWDRRASASPGWRGRRRRWRPVAASRCFGPSASPMPVTSRSMS